MRYLQSLREIALRVGCKGQASVLITHQVHLLVLPAAYGHVSRVTQAFDRRYLRYINYRYRRTGTLPGGRYKGPRSIEKPACCTDFAISSRTRSAPA